MTPMPIPDSMMSNTAMSGSGMACDRDVAAFGGARAAL
jgi:hypothetical protein